MKLYVLKMAALEKGIDIFLEHMSKENKAVFDQNVQRYGREYKEYQSKKENTPQDISGSVFSETATNYGRIIVSEKNLPNWEKSIVPVDAGGKAGGEKYIARGIFFKFAQDVPASSNWWIYGKKKRDDQPAMKGMGNDLKTIDAIRKTSTYISKSIKVPNMCLIDLNGFRLCAMTQLPISKHTLVYGTDDGGKTIHTSDSDERLQHIVNSLATDLNVSEHPVMEKKTSEVKMMKLAADVEVHKVENEYYILDCARVIPPNSYDRPLVNTFRMEYHLNQHPLSSDVFLFFGNLSKKVHDKQALEAIDEFENMIVSQEIVLFIDEKIIDPLDVSPIFHQKGINLRYMGIVLEKIIQNELEFESEIKKIIEGKISLKCILVQMILRSIKVVSQKMLRNSMNANEEISNLIKSYIFPSSFIENEGFSSKFEDIVLIEMESKYPFNSTNNSLSIETILEALELHDRTDIWKFLGLDIKKLRFFVEKEIGIISNDSATEIKYVPRIKLTTDEKKEIVNRNFSQYILHEDTAAIYAYVKTTSKYDIIPDLKSICEANHIDKDILFTLIAPIFHHFNWEDRDIATRNWFQRIGDEFFVVAKRGNHNFEFYSYFEKISEYSNSDEIIGKIYQWNNDFLYNIVKHDHRDMQIIFDVFLGYTKVVVQDELNRVYEKSKTLLHIAARYSKKAVKILLEQSICNLEHVLDSKKRTPEMIAAKYNPDCLKLLLSDQSFISSNGESTYMIACKNQLQSVKILTKKYNVVNSPDGNGDTPLMKAASSQYPEIVEFLLNNNADYSVENNDGKTALMVASENNLEMVKLLLNAGANINATSKNNRTALMLSIKENKEDIAEYLISQNAEIHIVTPTGWNALLYAANSIYLPKIVKLLINSGSNINQRTSKNWTPLHQASRYQPEAVGMLIDAGADIHAINNDGKTPLFLACKYNPESVRLLLKAGSNVNLRDNLQWTPLMVASRYQSQAVPLLLEFGADVNLRNRNGWAALNHACRYQSKAIDYLLKHNADINGFNKKGWTPLMHAARYNPESVKVLLKNNAEANVANGNGWSPLLHTARYILYMKN
eukprot:TRINITY_DN2182_c0_g1_i1.p1 TRINITY_DN2182_c0_g1~~TRINITY_DN2182_c0_g1_i1.p1  ORF type:complete len:1137 (-),score=253.40 TRINITY_DN2182_c0_g1_i1:302-3508(-)